MKKLIIILAILPFIVKAQLTPDSLLGCYAGTYMYKTEFDNDWSTVYADTIIVFNVDTIQKEVNDTIKDFIALGWKLTNPNSGYRFEKDFLNFCTFGFDFIQCPWGLDTMIENFCDTRSESIIFSNNDSIFFMHECWKNSQTEPYHYIRFYGKKYTSTIPDSLQSISVPTIKVDGSDNFRTRFLINDYCLENKKILVSGAINRFDGQVYTFNFSKEKSPCLRCFMPNIPIDSDDNCETEGVFGTLAGIVGSIQANEVVKEILGIGDTLCGHILIIDALKLTFRKVKLNRRSDCSCYEKK